MTLPGIMIVAMENQQWTNCIGTGSPAVDATYINGSLVGTYVSVPNDTYFGDTHPSLPNYLTVMSGSNHGVSDDNPPSSHTALSGLPYFMDQLDTASIPWLAYFENVGANPKVDNGNYAVKHNAIAYFGSSAQIAKCSLLNEGTYPYTFDTGFKAALNSAAKNTFVWVTPSLINDMHNSNPGTPGSGEVSQVEAGDKWLNTFIAGVQTTTWYANGGIICVWWDEAYNTSGGTVSTPTGPGGVGGGPTAFFLVSGNLKNAANVYGLNGTVQWTSQLTHIGLLQSIETYYGLSKIVATSGYGDISALLTNSANAGGGATNALAGHAAVTVAGNNPSTHIAFTAGTTNVGVGTNPALGVVHGTPPDTSVAATAFAASVSIVISGVVGFPTVASVAVAGYAGSVSTINGAGGVPAPGFVAAGAFAPGVSNSFTLQSTPNIVVNAYVPSININPGGGGAAEMLTEIQIRRDTAAKWTSVNPVLMSGEPALETDTGRQKIGNGASTWTQLGYMPARSSTVVVAASNSSATSKVSADYICTGTADHVTIQSAITNLPASGGRIQLTEGQYNFSGSVSSLVSNMAIEGQGDSTTLKMAASTNCQMISSSASISNVIFRNFVIDGNGSNQQDQASRDTLDLFYLVNISGLLIEGCVLKNGRHGAQVRLSMCNYATIINNRAFGMGLSAVNQCDAFFCRNSTHYRCIGNTITGATNPDTGFAQDGVDHSVVMGNTISSMGLGVSSSMSATEGSSQPQSSSNNVIANNTISGQGLASGSVSVGVKVSGFGNPGNGQIHDVTIIGNVVDNCDRAAWLEQVDRLNVVGNEFTNAVGANKQLVLLSTVGTMNDFSMRDNKLYNTTNRGVSFDAGAFGGTTVIQNNDFISVATPLGGTTPTPAIIRGNTGYNPVGSAVPGTAFALGSTGAVATNNTGVDGTLYVTAAGIVTGIQVNGVSVSGTVVVGDTYPLVAGGTFKWTGSGAPTVVFVGD